VITAAMRAMRWLFVAEKIALAKWPVDISVRYVHFLGRSFVPPDRRFLHFDHPLFYHKKGSPPLQENAP